MDLEEGGHSGRSFAISRGWGEPSAREKSSRRPNCVARLWKSGAGTDEAVRTDPVHFIRPAGVLSQPSTARRTWHRGLRSADSGERGIRRRAAAFRLTQPLSANANKREPRTRTRPPPRRSPMAIAPRKPRTITLLCAGPQSQAFSADAENRPGSAHDLCFELRGLAERPRSNRCRSRSLSTSGPCPRSRTGSYAGRPEDSWSSG